MNSGNRGAGTARRWLVGSLRSFYPSPCAGGLRIVAKRSREPQPSQCVLGLTAALALLPVVSAGQAFDPAAVLRFNTICARCHEGECSGRLSFSSGPEATFEHIRRYTGAIEPAIAHQLYAILAYMKRECAYVPLLPLAAPSRATRETLDGYREPSGGSYFIPLGVLAVGKHRLLLHLAQPATLRAEVLSEHFEPLVDELATTRGASLALEFRVEEPARCYLRLRGARLPRLEGLRLHSPDGSKDGPPARARGVRKPTPTGHATPADPPPGGEAVPAAQ